MDRAVDDRAAGDNWWAWGWNEMGVCAHLGEADGGWAAHQKEMANRGSAKWVGGRWLTCGPNGGLYIYAALRVWVLAFGPMDVPDARVRGPTLYEKDRTLDGFLESVKRSLTRVSKVTGVTRGYVASTKPRGSDLYGGVLYTGKVEWLGRREFRKWERQGKYVGSCGRSWRELR